MAAEKIDRILTIHKRTRVVAGPPASTDDSLYIVIHFDKTQSDLQKIRLDFSSDKLISYTKTYTTSCLPPGVTSTRHLVTVPSSDIKIRPLGPLGDGAVGEIAITLLNGPDANSNTSTTPVHILD